jgi:hypothetical protein
MIRSPEADCVCEYPLVYERPNLDYGCERCGGSVRRTVIPPRDSGSVLGREPSDGRLGLLSPMLGSVVALLVGLILGYYYGRSVG